MATMMAARDGWTAERLDDLNLKVDRLDSRTATGFSEVRAEFRTLRGEMKEEFRAVRAEMREEFGGVRAEIGALNRSFQQLTWGLIGVMLVGFLSLAAAIVAAH
jgi:hypothetical protein